MEASGVKFSESCPENSKPSDPEAPSLRGSEKVFRRRHSHKELRFEFENPRFSLAIA